MNYSVILPFEGVGAIEVVVAQSRNPLPGQVRPVQIQHESCGLAETVAVSHPVKFTTRSGADRKQPSETKKVGQVTTEKYLRLTPFQSRPEFLT